MRDRSLKEIHLASLKGKIDRVSVVEFFRKDGREDRGFRATPGQRHFQPIAEQHLSLYSRSPQHRHHAGVGHRVPDLQAQRP